MTPDLQNLLHRWREGSLTTEEMRTLTAELAKPEARAALRRDWFLEAALPQSLAASSVIVRTPQPSFVARLSGWFTRLFEGDAREEVSDLGALQLWMRTSFAALAVGLITSAWLVWPQSHETAHDSDAEQLVQIIFQKQFADTH